MAEWYSFASLYPECPCTAQIWTWLLPKATQCPHIPSLKCLITSRTCTCFFPSLSSRYLLPVPKSSNSEVTWCFRNSLPFRDLLLSIGRPLTTPSSFFKLFLVLQVSVQKFSETFLTAGIECVICPLCFWHCVLTKSHLTWLCLPKTYFHKKKIYISHKNQDYVCK